MYNADEEVCWLYSYNFIKTSFEHHDKYKEKNLIAGSRVFIGKCILGKIYLDMKGEVLRPKAWLFNNFVCNINMNLGMVHT
jgi:hypothetical protein